MSPVYIQFSDSTDATIVSYFGSPQDPEIYPNYAQIDTSDVRWKAYYDAQTAALQAYLPSPNTA